MPKRNFAVWSDRMEPKEAWKCEAWDHSEAAAKWAERYDANRDYPIISNAFDPLVHVTEGDDAFGDEETYNFRITAHAIPEYTAILSE